MKLTFPALARAAATAAGNAKTFAATVVLILLWGVVGPFCGFSDTWQLVANTATTIATTLLVLLVQNSQTRDTEAIQKKLDELIRVTAPADDKLIATEKKD